MKVSNFNCLPTPYQLTGDDRWKEGGEFFEKYDLKIEPGRDDNGDMDGDKDPDGSLNTHDDSYKINNIGDNGNSKSSVNLLSPITHEEYKKLRRESAKKQKQEPYDPNDAETQKFFEEFGDILRLKKDLKNPGNEPGRPEAPCFEVDKFTQDLDEYFEQDEGGEVEGMLAFKSL